MSPKHQNYWREKNILWSPSSKINRKTMLPVPRSQSTSSIAIPCKEYTLLKS